MNTGPRALGYQTILGQGAQGPFFSNLTAIARKLQPGYQAGNHFGNIESLLVSPCNVFVSYVFVRLRPHQHEKLAMYYAWRVFYSQMINYVNFQLN